MKGHSEKHIQQIAGLYDVGLSFEFKGEVYKIVEFKQKASKNPFVVEGENKERFLLPLTDNILKQIRKGKVIDIS